MDFEERQNLLFRITHAITPIKFGDIVYFVHDPTPLDLLKVKPYYDEIYKQLIALGIPSEDNLIALLMEKNLWSMKDEITLKTSTDTLNEYRRQLPKLTFKSLEKNLVLSNIKEIECKIKKLINAKSSLLSTSAEYIAKMEKFKKLIFLLTVDENNNRIWNNWNTFIKGNDHLINKLLSECYFNNNITENNIRYLAKNEPWRSTWLGGIKSGNLFNKPMISLTDYQRALVSWSIVYDNVYEHPECPSSDVIQNDELLDAWLHEQSEKREKDREKSFKDVTDNDKIQQSKEIGIFVDTPEDAAKVYKLNDAAGLAIIRTRENLLREKGFVKEIEMPDVRNELTMEFNRLEKKHAK